MPKITREKGYKSENYWLWNQSYEDPTANSDWTGEELPLLPLRIEHNDKKEQNDIKL